MGTGVQPGLAPAPAPVTRKVPEAASGVMELLNLIEQHKRLVLSSPFILAVILALIYAFGGNEFRRVLDFMSPGHFLGR
jgi:hypothetical protein